MNTLSIIIPVYNEEKRLRYAFKALNKGLKFDGLKVEKVIFVNDGSRDKTLQMLNAAKNSLAKQSKAKVEVISYEVNKGKGYAVRLGMLASNSDYSLLMDVDMSTPLAQLKKFIPSMKGNKQVIIGSRKGTTSMVGVHQPFYREILGKVFTNSTKVFLHTYVSDFTCGFKVFGYEAKEVIFSNSKINRWSYDAEIIFLARKFGYEIVEIPVKWNDRIGSKVKLGSAILQSIFDLGRIRYFQIERTISGVFVRFASEV